MTWTMDGLMAEMDKFRKRARLEDSDESCEGIPAAESLLVPPPPPDTEPEESNEDNADEERPLDILEAYDVGKEYGPLCPTLPGLITRYFATPGPYDPFQMAYHRLPKSKRLQRYVQRREKYFTRWDEGVCMTPDGWFSVTAEPLALQVAQMLLEGREPLGDKLVVVDAFAGCGGNTIGFARLEEVGLVIAVERDPCTAECLRRNAALYGVLDKVRVAVEDAATVLAELPDMFADHIHLSPPWGGPAYSHLPAIDIEDLPGMARVGPVHRSKAPAISLCLPWNTEPASVDQWDERDVCTVYHTIEDKTTLLTVVYAAPDVAPVIRDSVERLGGLPPLETE
ncbi:RNA cap guanine-N2 methyltransferase [Carpediemonas membranifera]|uniref:Trimethylguanosine synthase n=1 Tax=Carpediemonas membranifera TaxID=201153 RepID=A0A8J6E1J8_9EUKA|nr:RNA cap guanine-N2 methyltransferase [Carpediemonas membranifera]|eukprot:KAG9393563.1 RNA cap guanine-N2 methyltransferase [Carpediemonas membranifera]